MREILFRGKRVDNGEWVYGDLHHGPITGNIYIMGTQVIPETVGQYTGLKDKNGKEIYEGDIVLTDEAGWVGHVVYGHDCFMVVDDRGGFSSYCNWGEFEKIGNIHEQEG